MSSKNTVLMVLNRNHTLATTMGHILGFKKGEPTAVPRFLYQEALSIGAEPLEKADAPSLDERPAGAAPMDLAARAEAIDAAVAKIVGMNQRKDFTAAGSPSVKAVERELGYDVDGREVAAAWQRAADAKAAEQG